jgi:hypothetical protein
MELAGTRLPSRLRIAAPRIESDTSLDRGRQKCNAIGGSAGSYRVARLASEKCALKGSLRLKFPCSFPILTLVRWCDEFLIARKSRGV